MVDHQFADKDLAALYDTLHPPAERDDFAFYLPLVMRAERVLDVGCGTGAMLHLAREQGHSGHLVGLDPAEGMLEQAGRRTDVEWVRGDLSDTTLAQPFDLVVMTGHAFQVLLTDEEIRTALIAVRKALTDEGSFAFETRNPSYKAWESWNPDQTTTTIEGNPVRMSHEVKEVTAELVRFRSTWSSPAWSVDRHSESTLRFLGPARLSALLAEAGLAIRQRYGYWDRSPLTDVSPEIITIAGP